MFTEIFTGVQFFIFVLVIFTATFWIIPKKYQWVSFLITAILLAYMSYMLVPDKSDDLQLYYWFIDDMRIGGKDQFDYFVRQNDFDWKVYRASAYYYYFISRLPNDHYLPLFVVFISYGVNFCVINDASKKYNIDKIYTYLGTMFYLSTYWYYDLASGIRNGFAFALAFAASYYSIVAKKHYVLSFIGFLIAMFFHSGGIMPIVVAALTVVTLKIPGKAINFLSVFAAMAGSLILKNVNGSAEDGLVQNAAEKSDRYRGRYGIEFTTRYMINIAVIVVVVLLLLYFASYLKNNIFDGEPMRLYKLVSTTVFFTLGAIIVPLVFVRFVRWIIPIAGGLLFMVGMQLQKDEIVRNYDAYQRGLIPPDERLRYRLRPYVLVAFTAFTAVHLWYDCTGSSLIWAHFEHEWTDAGMEDYVW